MQKTVLEVLDAEFAGASDRAAVIVAAAVLDDALRDLLRSSMVEEALQASDIFSPSQPLGSLSARVKLAHLLGLIDESEKRRLTLIARVRNDFAHLASDLSFATPSVLDRCRELAPPPELVPPRQVPPKVDLDNLQKFKTPVAPFDDPRALFEEATLFLLYVLKGRLAQALVRRPVAAKPFASAGDAAGEFLAHAMVAKRKAIERGASPDEIQRLQEQVDVLVSIVVHATTGAQPRRPEHMLEATQGER
jgi:DNA-binding MltR family transcriptional regulator